MVENAVVFGANKTRAEEEMREAIELEMKLANVSTTVIDLLVICFSFACTLINFFCF